MTLTMPSLPPPRLSTIPCCPNCGHDLSLTISPPKDLDEQSRALRDAKIQIGDLQTQIRLLNAKATAAVDRWADYEDELNKLRRQLNEQRPQSPTTAAAGVTGFAAAATNRISAYLSKKSTPNLKAQPSPGHQTSFSTSRLAPAPLSSSSSYASASSPGHQTSYSTSSLLTPKSSLSLSLSRGTIDYTPGSSPPPSTDDLLEALTREQQLRLAAEGKLNDTSNEVEELSVTLFEQANEMVAHERKMRARLEERVGELEKREEEKKRRLERLEASMGRIERARGLLAERGKA